ncbi:MAG: PqqD family protein [Bryobacteraceae bacterium]
MKTSPANPPPDVLAQYTGGSLILLNLKTDRIHELNSTAAALWELLVAGASLEDAAAEFHRQYVVSEEEVRAEIGMIAAQLHSEGLVAG